MRAPHFALFLLLYLVILLQPTDSRVLLRDANSINTFVRQVTVNFEKAKVETLGDIFKRHVQQLRHTPNGMVELVFLIDSSGTVGKSYFFEEVRFVRYLLSDFTVDINATRVSVITFSSRNKIFRYIDYLSHPNEDNHKCRLLTEDIPRVDYTPGGTDTLGAFLEAEKVLKSARPDAVKAIFLMTDGYSNGGDPRPVAKKLKKEGVKIFTFGIRDGFVWELQDMASEPKNETCYILDSFEEFEALAKRALHADLQSGSYVEQSANKCRRLCISENLCCHGNATCTCGTYTGKYECLCKAGYYGTGRGKTGCKACPPGTYKNQTSLGNIETCAPCPDEHQTTPPGAVSIAQCVCKRGYRSFGNRSCTVFRCPELSPPKHGYFVNNKCNNVFNAACGLKCQHGYELRGSSLRICQDNGTWSGQPAECIMKTCPSLPAPKNGHMICSSDDYSYSTVCRFTCNAGYQLVGSRKRICLAIAHWNGIATICREITCPPLVEIKDGLITPQSCTQREVVFGTTCHISCSSEYTLKGPHNKQCTPDGTWLATGTGVNQCVDQAPPVLQCPENVEIEADEVEAMTEMHWSPPVPVDNSGFRPVLTADPAVTPGSKLPIGVTIVTYKAEDLSQNVATCKFYINIVDKTPPRVDKCQSPSPFVSSQEKTNITLEVPVFSDNSGLPVEVVSSFNRGELFPVGTTKVTYTAFDNANNNSTCDVEVTVIRHLCGSPSPPVHGDVTCKEGEIGVLCHIFCNTGYAFAVPPAEEYFCAYEDGRWLPLENFPFPDCAETQISNEIQQPATITLTGDLSCNDKELINKIQVNLEGKMEDKILTVCDNDVSCSVGSLKAVCEDDEDFNRIQLLPDKLRSKRLIRTHGKQPRSRRDAHKKSRLSFEILLEGMVKNNVMGTGPNNKSEPLMKALAILEQEASQGFLDLNVDDHPLMLSQFSYDPDLLSYKCPEGSVLKNETCVKCPVGTYYLSENKTCQDCPVGTYQGDEGLASCTRCPPNKSTEKENAKSENECKAFCPSGSFSSNGLEPCETCHFGFYQPNVSTTDCLPCPNGKITLRRGSKQEEDCTILCQPGTMSKDGLAPCVPCPLNTYQPKSGQTECIYCPHESGTAFNGSKSSEDCIYDLESLEIQSDEAKGKGFSQQLYFSSGCVDDPCENGGTCVFAKGVPNFKCHCTQDYTGTKCETKLNYCSSAPCSNGGTCNSKIGGFTCSCKPGFQGTRCEVDIDECLVSPCINNGTCIDGINSFKCNCPVPYTGPTCSGVISNCAEVVCLNGGFCVNTQSSFKCNCQPGFTGTTCEVDVDECAAYPCKNDGTCTDLPNDYKCHCMPGFTAKNCAIQIDECADAPCQNGATCEDLLNNYRCHCTAGFTGNKCEKAMTSQYQLDFAASSVTDFAELTIDQPMSSVTVSFWVKSNDPGHGGTPFSYAVKGYFNAFTVTRLEGLILYINDEQRSISTKVNDGKWHHVVFTWSNDKGNWRLFVDGILKDEGFDLSTKKPIPGKGIFIVGQEQDSLGGGFSPAESLSGTLTHLNVWDQEFSSQEVEKLRFTCDSFEGNIVAWSKVQTSLKGNIAIKPSIFCQDCPIPKSPPNGMVIYTDTKAGSSVEFQCNAGYTANGPDVLRCMISREYENDNKFPDCEVISCGSPRASQGMLKLKGKDFSYGKKVTIECSPGYYLQGDPEKVCDEFGDWVGSGTCVVKKCTLPDDLKNTIKSINKTEFSPKETVQFSCKQGSFLQSRHNSVTCQLGGLWDKSIPSCDLIKCTNPPGIVNGSLADKNKDYNIGDVAMYQCNTGHEFSSVDGSVKDSVPCLATGKWDTTLPRCVTITCRDPPRQRFAVAVGEGRTYLSSVRYECLPGFSSTDKNIIECEADKEWSPLKLNCSRISCEAPPAFGNGSILVTDYKFESVITYQCYQGYILQGVSSRKCMENKTWSDMAPICDPVSCGSLPNVANGKVTYADVTYLNTASFTCNPGYELSGSEESTCEASGNWLPDPPTCQPKPCPLPQDIEFGTYSVSGPLFYQATVTYMCSSGYRMNGIPTLSCLEDGRWSAVPPSCVFIQCPDVGNLTNGFVAVQGRTLSSTVAYSCQPGYKLSGPSTRTCQSNSTWSHQSPSCLPTNCLSPENILNGRREYKDLSVGSIVSYSCDKGYQLEGKDYRRCLDNLTFSDPAPLCKPVVCDPLGTVTNGMISLSDQERIFTSTATVTCNEGYNFKGINVLKCESTGQWSSSLPTCVAIVCNIAPVQNGQTNSTTAVYKSVISYECNSGFKLVGNSIRECLANGTWDSAEPTCEIVRCPELQLENGIVSSRQRTVGTVVTLDCKGNYYLIGTSSRTCQSNGQWSGDDPSCSRIISCPPPVQVLHGQLQAINETTVQYECDKGYSLLGASLAICGPDGLWRPSAPVCKIKTCDDLSQSTIPNGKIVYKSNEYKSVVSYMCNTGYILKGNNQSKCKEDGQWEGAQPECQIVRCGLLHVTNGVYNTTNFSFGSVVTIVCKQNFKLKGAENVTCLSTGLWEIYNTSCEPIDCPALTPDIPNGKVVVSTNLVNGVAKYECNKGYRAHGSKERECLESGQWSGVAPDCERIFCPALTPDIPNGKVVVNTTLLNGVAKYECEEGYRVQGSGKRVCLESGQWSGAVPDCERVFCPEPDPVEHAVLKGDSREYGAVISYTCEEAYYLYGDTSLVCQQNGKWSSMVPECEPVRCQEPSPPSPHRNVLVNEDTVGSIMTFYCDEGYELVGAADRQCQLNGKWSGSDPWCTNISCGEPPAIHHASIIQPSDNLYQSTVQYSCQEGFTASGLDRTSCLSNKSWSYTDFACTIISCPAILPSAVPNSILQALNFTFGSAISFSCIQGYTLSGSSNLTCTAQGNWSSALPSCHIVQCPPLGQLEFGTVTSSSNDYNSRAMFSCHRGYTLVEDSETQCLASGTWSLPKPICQIVSCGDLPVRIPNGILISPQLEYLFQQGGSYSCEFGYNLTGSPTLTCTETGQFDYTLPTCLRTPCPPPTAMDFGTFQEANYTAFYECFSGYELVGASELNCLLGGKWSGQAPSCQPVPCPILASPDNGGMEGTEFYFGELVRFSCKEGYNLIGSSELECLANQSWTDIQPYCAPVDCGAPKEHFSNGFFNGTYIYGGGVEYHCHPGFQLLGDKLRLCQANGLWETSVQICSRLSCPAPEFLTNGYITGSSYFFEANITYGCNEGYQLVGDSLYTCLSDLSWSGQVPACEKISCGTPPILTNGQTLGDSYLFQDQVILTCDFGYRLNGVASRTCESDGQWSGLAQCDQIVCKDAPNLVNGKYRLVSNHGIYAVLSVVQYECDRGYILNGTHERTCLESGLWSDDPVSCHPISCSPIPSLEYGAVVGSSFTFLSVVNFTCQAGFDLKGQKSIECNYTGDWSDQMPYCKVISCPDIAIQHGSASLKDSSQVTPNRNGSTYIYGDRITFDCHEGHERVENWISSECQVDGSWSNPSITCTPVKCLLPTGIEHSNISWSSLTYQSIITVSCIAGYDLIGENELTCGADRNWVESLPKCVLLACGSPPSVQNAIIEGDSFKLGDYISYKCKSGYDLVGNAKIQCGNGSIWVGILPECVEVDCGPAPVLQAATVTAVSTTYKSQANLLCNVGYVLRGDTDIVCSADRTWKHDPNLHCAAIDCGDPPHIEHGAFSASNTTLGNLASYSCDKGYFLKDVSSVLCSDDGSWIYDLPECIPVDCFQPLAVPHASFAYNGTHYLQKVKYQCEIGFQLPGGDTELELTCAETGTWLGDTPACEAVDCGWPPSAASAYYHLDNNRTDYTSLAVYHCLAGHSSPKADNVLSCSASGVWDGDLISCSPLNCTDLPTLDHGLYDFTNGTVFGSVISYNCARGFTKTGSALITCTEEGKWTNEYHACLPVNCQNPPGIDNGEIEFDKTIFGALAVYSCLPGYTMAGNETVECTDAGDWSSVSPICQPVDCEAPPSVSHGHVTYDSSKFQSVAIYSCDSGYQIGQATTLTCTELASWEGQQPVCSIVNCSKPVTKPFAIVPNFNLSYLSSVSYTCQPGYKLIGNNTITCLETGQWSGEPPDCTPLNCSSPVQILNGNLTASGTTFGSSVTYTCSQGYHLKGDAVIYCNEHGAWSSAVHSCELLDCMKPAGIANGQVSYITTTFASLATYLCDNGFLLKGNSTLHCDESGLWASSGTAPVCEVVQCPEPPSFLNGRVRYTNLTHGSLATFSCNAGYTPTESHTLVCWEDGTWLGETPACEEILCPEPPQIQNGHHLNRNTSVGVRVEYKCAAGYILNGISFIECQSDGTWSSQLPVCIPITCPNPPAVRNTRMTAKTGNSVGSTVMYSCLKGFEMTSGSDIEVTIVCLQTGQWGGEMPTCTKVTCRDPPPLVPFSSFITTGDTYTSEAYYTCQMGHQLRGSGKTTCNHLGQWSTDQPTVCNPVSCGPPPERPLSSYQGSSFTFNQSVTYKCNPGHVLIGSSTSNCGADGSWTPLAFQCQIKQCTEVFALPENGEIVGRSSHGPFVVGAAVSFKCVGGYTLVGQPTMTCTDSGDWSSEPPLCENIIGFCKETLPVDNISSPPPGQLTGNQITLMCLPGYVARGNMTSACQSDGSWTLPTGSCERVFCGKPVVDQPLNVKLIGQNYFYGDQVAFICQLGFVPQSDNSVLTCQENGQWDGEARCTAFCKQDCLNGGACIGSNRCKCLPGWAGFRCEKALCIFNCLHGGQCIAPYKCQCRPGYDGSRCEKVICSKPCQNGGRCIAPNRCQCPHGYSGPVCETLVIQGKKSKNG